MKPTYQVGDRVVYWRFNNVQYYATVVNHRPLRVRGGKMVPGYVIKVHSRVNHPTMRVGYTQRTVTERSLRRIT